MKINRIDTRPRPVSPQRTTSGPARVRQKAKVLPQRPKPGKNAA